jgi:hypothetical protein
MGKAPAAIKHAAKAVRRKVRSAFIGGYFRQFNQSTPRAQVPARPAGLQSWPSHVKFDAASQGTPPA